MRIVALYKTFRGEEFVTASLQSIYNSVDKIVMVHSNISWTGQIGNTVLPEVIKWKKEADVFDKIVNLTIDTESISQEEQYKIGFRFITDNIKYDYIMLIDTDEVWEQKDLEKAFTFIKKHPEYNSFSVSMRTYIKSPFYRLTNIEPCKPVVFIKKGGEGIQGVRGNGIKPRILIPDTFFHHFAYVRKDDKSVFEKIISSTFADGLELVDLKKWKVEKWRKMPKSTNFHTSKGYESYLEGLEVISFTELPQVLQERIYEIVRIYQTDSIEDLISRHKLHFSHTSFEVEPLKKELLLEYIDKENSILEVGTLTGNNLFFLYENGYTDLTGIDFLEPAISIAENYQKEIGSNIKFECCDLYSFEEECIKYDKIILFDVLEHVINVGLFLGKVKELLSEKGTVLVLVPKGKEFYDCGHINFYPDLECLRNLLTLYFHVEEMSELNNKLFFICRKGI